MGVIIQKKDGGYLYTTTDIACAKYRYETLHADRVLYYIDSRQHQHLMQAWTIVRKAGYVPDSVPLEHHMFGMMLGKDGKPFKTRAGGTVKLADLLDEALERARRPRPRRTRICRLTSWKIWRKWWVSARLNMPTCRKPHHRLRLRLG